MLKLALEYRDTAHILHMQGRLTLGTEVVAFRDTVEKLTGDQPVTVIVDFSEVPYIDSAGIGELVAAYTRITSRGGRMALAALPKRVRDLLQITKLYTVFEVFDTVGDAVRALNS
jgi:anti-sigma B factor antagonist